MKILSLSVSNFFSFGEEQEFVFADSLKRLVGDQRFELLPNGQSVSMASVILGGNGSGKTNALKALSFLSWFTCESARGLDEGERILFRQFSFNEKKEPTEMSLYFEHEGLAYYYCLILDSDLTHVLYEEISCRKENSKRYSYLFKREYDSINRQTSIAKKSISLSVRALKTFLRPNCSILSASRAISSTGLEVIREAFSMINANIGFRGRLTDETEALEDAIDFFTENENYKQIAENIIVDLDLGIAGLRYSSNEMKLLFNDIFGSFKRNVKGINPELVDNIASVSAVHIVNNREYELELMHESGGTKGLYCLLQHIVPALVDGGVAVIDELELGLHPYMVEKIVELFLNPGTNPKRAQLIASTHMVNVVEQLDPRQILLMEKDEETLQSEVWRLSDVKGVLPRDNILRGYLSGKYGAVPRI